MNDDPREPCLYSLVTIPVTSFTYISTWMAVKSISTETPELFHNTLGKYTPMFLLMTDFTHVFPSRQRLLKCSMLSLWCNKEIAKEIYVYFQHHKEGEKQNLVLGMN